jgi:hypothetical protein
MVQDHKRKRSMQLLEKEKLHFQEIDQKVCKDMEVELELKVYLCSILTKEEQKI